MTDRIYRCYIKFMKDDFDAAKFAALYCRHPEDKENDDDNVHRNSFIFFLVVYGLRIFLPVIIILAILL